MRILLIALISFTHISSLNAQKTISHEKYKLEFTFNDTIWEPIHALDFGGFKNYVAQSMPNIDLIYGLNPKNANGLKYPYILIGVEQIENPSMEVLEKELEGIPLDKKSIEEAKGEKLLKDISKVKISAPIIDKENALVIIMTSMTIDTETKEIINVQVYKLGDGQRAMITFYMYDDPDKQANLKQFWEIVYSFQFENKYNPEPEEKEEK